MNGESSIDMVGDVLNQGDFVESYPMDFSGSVYEPLPVEEVYEVSPAQRVQVWAQSPIAQEQEAAPENKLLDFFSNVLDIAGKSYQQVTTQEYLQKYKVNPYISTALEKLGYPTVRKVQTGLDTGKKVVPLSERISGMVSSISPSYILLGIAVVAVVFFMGKK